MTMKTRYLVPLLCSFLMACGVAWGAVPSISVRDADKLRGGAVQFVDVREEYQFIGWDSEEGPGGHIAGAMDASWCGTKAWGRPALPSLPWCAKSAAH